MYKLVLRSQLRKTSATALTPVILRVTIFFRSFVDAAVHRTSKLRRGDYGRLQGFQAAYQPRDNMGSFNLKFYPLLRVCVWKYEHVQWTPCRFSPPGDACGAEKGVAVHLGDASWSCPD